MHKIMFNARVYSLEHESYEKDEAEAGHITRQVSMYQPRVGSGAVRIGPTLFPDRR